MGKWKRCKRSPHVLWHRIEGVSSPTNANHHTYQNLAQLISNWTQAQLHNWSFVCISIATASSKLFRPLEAFTKEDRILQAIEREQHTPALKPTLQDLLMQVANDAEVRTELDRCDELVQIVMSIMKGNKGKTVAVIDAPRLSLAMYPYDLEEPWCEKWVKIDRERGGRFKHSAMRYLVVLTLHDHNIVIVCPYGFYQMVFQLLAVGNTASEHIRFLCDVALIMTVSLPRQPGASGSVVMYSSGTPEKQQALTIDTALNLPPPPRHRTWGCLSEQLEMVRVTTVRPNGDVCGHVFVRNPVGLFEQMQCADVPSAFVVDDCWFDLHGLPNQSTTDSLFIAVYHSYDSRWISRIPNVRMNPKNLKINFAKWLTDVNIPEKWEAWETWVKMQDTYPGKMLSSISGSDIRHCAKHNTQRWTPDTCMLTNTDILALLANYLDRRIFCISQDDSGGVLRCTCTCYRPLGTAEGTIVICCRLRGKEVVYHATTKAKSPFLSLPMASVYTGDPIADFDEMNAKFIDVAKLLTQEEYKKSGTVHSLRKMVPPPNPPRICALLSRQWIINNTLTQFVWSRTREVMIRLIEKYVKEYEGKKKSKTLREYILEQGVDLFNLQQEFGPRVNELMSALWYAHDDQDHDGVDSDASADLLTDSDTSVDLLDSDEQAFRPFTFNPYSYAQPHADAPYLLPKPNLQSASSSSSSSSSSSLLSSLSPHAPYLHPGPKPTSSSSPPHKKQKNNDPNVIVISDSE